MTTDSMCDPESKLFIMWSFTDFQLEQGCMAPSQDYKQSNEG